MKHLGILMAAVACLALTAGAPAGGSGVQQPPAESVTGTWALDIDTGSGLLSAELALQQDGKDVTGTFSGLHDMTLVVQGRWDAGELTLSTHGDGHGGEQLSLGFKGRLQKDATLKGSLTTHMGEVTWVARRVPRG